jgi:hypothetical protein
MMHLKTLGLAALILLSAPVAEAQTGAPERKRGTITFESRPTNGTRSRHSRRQQKETRKNSLSVGIISPLLHGFLPFSYERALGSAFGLQVTAGLTYRSLSNDLGEAVLPRNEDNINFLGSGNITDDYTSYAHRRAKPGYMAGISPRFYPGGDNALDGFFLSPAFEYKHYRFESRLADGSLENTGHFGADERDIPRTEAVMQESLRCLDIMFQIGGHHQTGNHLVIGWSFAVGIRTDNSTRQNIEETYNGSSFQLVNYVREFSSTRPLMQVNFLLGGAF